VAKAEMMNDKEHVDRLSAKFLKAMRE
jgi:cysteine desulfurase